MVTMWADPKDDFRVELLEGILDFELGRVEEWEEYHAEYLAERKLARAATGKYCIEMAAYLKENTDGRVTVGRVTVGMVTDDLLAFFNGYLSALTGTIQS